MEGQARVHRKSLCGVAGIQAHTVNCRSGASPARVALSVAHLRPYVSTSASPLYFNPQLVVDLLTDNVRCHTGSVHVASAKVGKLR